MRKYSIEDLREKARIYYGSKRREQREFINELKSVPCTDCNQSYPPEAMDFDHRPGEEKLFLVSRMMAHGREKLLAEVSKCDIVCSNCHRIRTHRRLEV